MSRKCCRNCKWFGPNASEMWDCGQDDQSDAPCLRYPPLTYIAPSPLDDEIYPHVDHDNWHWPWVKAVDFCGEHVSVDE